MNAPLPPPAAVSRRRFLTASATAAATVPFLSRAAPPPHATPGTFAEPARAIPHYEATLRLQPRQPKACNNLAITFLQTDRLPDAIRFFERAIELDSAFADPHNNLGVVLMEQDNYGEARVMFQKAFALDSGETDSIRENLMLAIAKSEASVYDPTQEEQKGGFRLVRQEKGKFVLLSDL